MRVTVPVMIQDPSLKGTIKVDTESCDEEMFSCFLNGPITDRVAIIDFHPVTGQVVPGALFEPPKGRGKKARYIVKDTNKFKAADFCQCTTFGTIAGTIQMFEEPDVLGRKVSWACQSPQLLVVPRAGEWANAFYQRESSSLQFFFFKSKLNPRKTIFTCLSRDIVAHETGHAVLDGVCPWLYNAISPQSLALHEAIADLTALIMAFRNKSLCEMVYKNEGSIKKSSVFSAIAEEFGKEQHPGGLGYLRNLDNEEVLDKSKINADPHILCNVLTGAIYKVALKLFDYLYKEQLARPGTKKHKAFHVALYLTHQRLGRMLFRALDYLPPGEVSFADYGRAIMAADKASHLKYSKERKWLIDEFLRRDLVENRQILQPKTNYRIKGLDFDLDDLVESDWVAYKFVGKHRRLLGIPENTPFEVHPRLDVTKKYYVGEGKIKEIRECIVKVEWQHAERNPKSLSLSNYRRITVGATLAIDWDRTEKLRKAGKNEMFVRAVLKTILTDKDRKQRNMFLGQLVDDGILMEDSTGLDGKEIQTAVTAEIENGFLRVRGTARSLFLRGEHE
ncbi:MAG: gluzincin family metallopeptidase [Planctomycetota bacterium]